MNLPFLHHQAKLPDKQAIGLLPMLLKQHYPANSEQTADALNRLYLAWLFREFHPSCDLASKNSLHVFQQPEARLQLIGSCPAGLTDYLHIYDKLANDTLYWQDVPLSSLQQQQMQQLRDNHRLLNTQLLAQAPWQQQMALLCTTIILQHCQRFNLIREQDDMLHNGMDNAFLALWQAIQHNGHGLRAWLGSFMQTIALLLIRQHIAQQAARPNEHQLLLDIAHYQHRLAYWISKDWGLPDDILHSLRQRFLPEPQLSGHALIMQRSEHIGFVLDTRRHAQFSKRHSKQMLLSLHYPPLTPHINSLL